MKIAGRALAPAGAAALLAAAGFCAPRTLELPAAGAGSALAYRDFHAAEQGFRWSREASRIRVPEPGPGLPVRVEVEMSGWRPPGSDGPLVSLAAGGARREARAERRFATLDLDTTTSGWWSSDLVVELRSETFRPGPHDPRELGARVVATRLVPQVGPGLRRPPLRPLVWSAAAVLLLEALLLPLGFADAGRRRAGAAMALALALGLFFARATVAPLLGALVAALAVLALLARLAPPPARRAAGAVAELGFALARGARQVPASTAAALAAAAVLAPTAAQLARPVVSLDLGSGRSAGAAVRFGPLDSDGSIAFRRADRGARLELPDLGGGPDWNVTLQAALASGPRELTVVQSGHDAVRTVLGPEWTTLALRAPADVGWRAGATLEFPDAQPHLGLRISRVQVDRGRSLPSPRLAALLLLAALATAAIPGALGAGRLAALAAGVGSTVLAGLALAVEPVAASRFAGGWLAVAVSGLGVAALAAAVHGGAARRGATFPRVALVGPALGFVAWLAALTFPLYRGGHFEFHSGIAEEIWGGRFWVYYLPYPGSMLSRQAHWGDLIFPHPCTFHVAAAPLAALGAPAFHVAVKAMLSAWLAVMAVCAAVLAHRSGGARAAVLAGAALPLIPASYQIVGLGHLMTLCGCFATAVALTFLTLRLRRLDARASWWGAAALLGMALLAYFAAVPFLLIILGLTLLWLWRTGEAPVARAVLGAGLAGAAIAFALYYVNWAWPFLTETVPTLLSRGGHAGEASGTLERLLLQPGKLAYTFGSAALPLLAAAGLVWRVRCEDRAVLWPWLALLPIVSLLDLRFNFLLKHHYFTMVPVAVGIGLVLERALAAGRTWRAVARVALVGMAVLAVQLAGATAFGWIP